MNIQSIDFGEIFAWIVMIILFMTGKISFEVFILFSAIKFTVKLNFR